MSETEENLPPIESIYSWHEGSEYTHYISYYHPNSIDYLLRESDINPSCNFRSYEEAKQAKKYIEDRGFTVSPITLTEEGKRLALERQERERATKERINKTLNPKGKKGFNH